MKKLLKKSAPNKQLKKAKSFPSPAICHNDNDMMHGACEAVREKYMRVEHKHNAPLPASPEFLRNYESIFGHE